MNGRKQQQRQLARNQRKNSNVLWFSADRFRDGSRRNFPGSISPGISPSRAGFVRSQPRAVGRQEVTVMTSPLLERLGDTIKFHPFSSKYQKWAQRHVFLLSTLAFFFVVTWVLEVVTKYVL